MRLILWLTLFIIPNLCSLEAFAQERPSYQISIKHQGDQMILSCKEGCDWKQLSFTKPTKHAPQAIDRSGMVEGATFTTGDDHPYYFSIYEQDNYVYLKGGNDNGFLSLGFTLMEQQVQWIDQNGMIR